MRGKPITAAAQMTSAAKIHTDRHCMPEEDHDVYRYLWTAIQTHNWAFPAPPWPVSERLTPVRDAASMRKAAKYFRNCLRQHIRPALAGNNAYYLWGGGEPVIVQVKRLPPWGWILWGIAGRANSRVSRQTYAAIQLEFKQAPGIHAEWDYNDDGNSNRVIAMPRFVMALEDAFGMELE